MRSRQNPVEALGALPKLEHSEQRRAQWRQVIAALGAKDRVTGPPPLEGADPRELQPAVQIALETGLADDVEWIAPGNAAVALYELTAALPPSPAKRELGRRVFARLYEGQAATFAAVATRMALWSSRSLEPVTLAARVSLVFDLPIGTSVNADALAFTLTARPELFQRWLAGPSTGALPARRGAAKILEHAAREAMNLALEGDSYPRRLLVSETVRPLLDRLLADREPLVWRHAAVARGLIATVDSNLQNELELALDPGLTPTQWRRAAVSLVAMLVGDPVHAMQHCRGLLESGLMRQDPGLAATMLWGLPPVIEEEPDAAEELLDRVSMIRRPGVAQATAELLDDLASPTFGARAAQTLRAVFESGSDPNEGVALRIITQQALRQLERGKDQNTLHAGVIRALGSFENCGARQAYEDALQAAQYAQRELIEIAMLDPEQETALPEMTALLSDLDANALERSRLHDLLLLGRHPGDPDTTVPEMERLYDSIGTWLLDTEEAEDDFGAWTQLRVLSKQRRLRALLHLVDLETSAHSEQSRERVNARVQRAVDLLLRKLASGPDGSVHRILCATTARTLDAAVRHGLAEPTDVWLLLAARLSDHETLMAIAEASTNPEVRPSVAAYARFVELGGGTLLDDEGGITDPRVGAAEHLHVDARVRAQQVATLSQGLGTGGSYRGEALRQVVLRIGRALEAMAMADGLSDLVGSDQSGVDSVGDLEAACDELRLLQRSARRRVLGGEPGEWVGSGTAAGTLSKLLERAHTGAPAATPRLALTLHELCAELPPPLASVIHAAVLRIQSLPVQAPPGAVGIPLEQRRGVLPDWLLPRRTIGAFYVVRALGSGGVSSVFMARRFEERHDRKAEAFALKVPQYDPSTARRLSEQEFLQLFREEAGALLSIPVHPNLARFVTFDLAARPKPILVMELIHGVGLDRLVRSRALTTERALRHLAGVLSGLDAMHRVGVGHLDVKPSNIILRHDETPVLVDFGLSGRQLRPGCGTLEYTAPEVLGLVPHGHVPAPMAADLYSFACSAFEILTGTPLFDAEEELTVISQHVSHDGWPPRLAALASTPALRDLCLVVAACLRRDPRDRPSAAAALRALWPLVPQARDIPWPLGSNEAASTG